MSRATRLNSGVRQADAAAAFAAVGSFTLGPVTQLTIPTYDGSGQTTHPCVIDLGASPISGYRYWMAHTPYPGTDNTKENPSVVASNDLVTWQVPAGLTNPIVAYPGTGVYNSDNHLIWWQSKFWLYYRVTGSGPDYLAVKTSTDGISWSAPTVVLQPATSWSSVSPAFRIINGRVMCWYVRSQGGPTTYPTDVFQMESLDGLNFRNPRKCSVTLPGGATPWHLDVDYGTTDAGDPIYLLATNAFTASADGNHASLYFATSADGVNFEGRGPSITPTAGTWYNQGIYRPNILRNSSGLFRVFFGAYNTGGQSHIGYADVTPKWGDPHKATSPKAQFTEKALAEAFVGSAYTVGTTKMKGNAPTLILPKATSSAATMWKLYHVPYGVAADAVVDIYWLTEDANAGNIRFRVFDVDTVIGTDNLGGSASANAVVDQAASGVANVLQKSSVRIQTSHLKDRSLATIRVSRDGQDAADTYASDVLLLGFRVRYGEGVSIV